MTVQEQITNTAEWFNAPGHKFTQGAKPMDFSVQVDGMPLLRFEYLPTAESWYVYGPQHWSRESIYWYGRSWWYCTIGQLSVPASSLAMAVEHYIDLLYWQKNLDLRRTFRYRLRMWWKKMTAQWCGGDRA